MCHEVKTFALGFTIPAIMAFVEDTRSEVCPAFRSLQKPCVQSLKQFMLPNDPCNAKVQLHLRLSGGLLTCIPSCDYQATFSPRGLTLWTISSMDNRTFYDYYVTAASAIT